MVISFAGKKFIKYSWIFLVTVRARVRREPHDYCLSTLESVAYSLRFLEPTPGVSYFIVLPCRAEVRRLGSNSGVAELRRQKHLGRRPACAGVTPTGVTGSLSSVSVMRGRGAPCGGAPPPQLRSHGTRCYIGTDGTTE